MKRNYFIGIAIGVVLWLCIGTVCCQTVMPMAAPTAGSNIVVLDPGHGGMDGGAESGDGTCEKDINLAIAKYLKVLLEKQGIRVVLTRTNDEGLYHDTGKEAIRTLKTQDMKARKARIDGSGADLTVSIHLNSFTQDSAVRGAQVFYPSDGDETLVKRSKYAAELMQNALNQSINGDSPRTALGKNDVFLLKDITGPIVIAECGFLSNPQDRDHLKDANHQKIISGVLNECIVKYLKTVD